MEFKLNEAPEEVLEIFRSCGFETYQAIESLCEEARSTRGIQYAWPQEAIVMQDASVLSYCDCLLTAKIPHYVREDQTILLTWQLRQVYRVMNAAISSADISLIPFVDKLLSFRQQLEKNPILRSLLDDIATSTTKPDLVCSGHGEWNMDTDGYTLLPPQTKITFYCGLGATLANGLGIEIENNRYNFKYVAAKDEKSGKIEMDMAYAPYSYQSCNNRPIHVPNMLLASDGGLFAKLIEPFTGRILLTADEINLEQIFKIHPGRTIHWAACMTTYKKDFSKYGPYVDKMWCSLSYEERKKIAPPIKAAQNTSHFFHSTKKASGKTSKHHSDEKYHPYRRTSP